MGASLLVVGVWWCVRCAVGAPVGATGGLVVRGGSRYGWRGRDVDRSTDVLAQPAAGARTCHVGGVVATRRPAGRAPLARAGERVAGRA
ncbi:hypothetical protein [Streptomyces sp. NBC_00057]|uniref:hypothetical protein n=1 Tax=Streptomyces sp. NBC_00057 TaxID=2975634 RepID=UPI0032516CCA